MGRSGAVFKVCRMSRNGFFSCGKFLRGLRLRANYAAMRLRIEFRRRFISTRHETAAYRQSADPQAVRGEDCKGQGRSGSCHG